MLTLVCTYRAVNTHMNEEQQTERLQMRVAPSFLAKVDEWRASQRPLPSRSEAIRMLVEAALRSNDGRARNGSRDDRE